MAAHLDLDDDDESLVTEALTTVSDASTYAAEISPTADRPPYRAKARRAERILARLEQAHR